MTREPEGKTDKAMDTTVSFSGGTRDPLRTYVRKGQLFDVQAWISAGKPIYSNERRKKNVLQIAVEKGFHAMVDVLASTWPDNESLNAALQQAVYKRRVDIAWLLAERGAKHEICMPRVGCGVLRQSSHAPFSGSVG